MGLMRNLVLLMFVVVSTSAQAEVYEYTPAELAEATIKRTYFATAERFGYGGGAHKSILTDGISNELILPDEKFAFPDDEYIPDRQVVDSGLQGEQGDKITKEPIKLIEPPKTAKVVEDTPAEPERVRSWWM